MKIQWANPWIGREERNELNCVFDSLWLGMGPRTKLFEEKIGSYIGIKHAIAVSNGTDALDLALKALGVAPKDEVIMPAMTYIATVNSVLYQYATPVFADIEMETFNIDPSAIEKLITKRTKCIMYIDYGGIPAYSEKLKEISQSFGIPLLQDGAQSFGAEMKGEKLCKQGLICTTSFHIAKLMTTVEGGMVFTNNDNLAADIRMRRNQGESPNKKYIHEVLGTNARMTDLQAAIGLKQFEKFDMILKKRRYIAEFYYNAFAKNKNIQLPVLRNESMPAWFFAPILVENRDIIAKELNTAGIATRIAYPMPVYEQPFFQPFKKKGQKYCCSNAKWITERILNLPIFHEITDKQLSYIAGQALRIIKKNA